jgi:hypothetical protein
MERDMSIPMFELSCFTPGYLSGQWSIIALRITSQPDYRYMAALGEKVTISPRLSLTIQMYHIALKLLTDDENVCLCRRFVGVRRRSLACKTLSIHRQQMRCQA